MLAELAAGAIAGGVVPRVARNCWLVGVGIGITRSDIYRKNVDTCSD